MSLSLFSLVDKIALVTGSGQGIGLAWPRGSRMPAPMSC